jgi:hypothetical protein
VSRAILNEPALAGEGPCAIEAAETLARGMREARGAVTTAAGGVDHARLIDSGELAAAEAAARRLAGVRLATLAQREARLSFWINVYNALVVHGIARLGVRGSVVRAWNFFGRACYRIDGLVFSVDDVEHGVLRGNRRRRLPPWRAFGAGDPRRAHALDHVDPRVHFALNCGARSCPPVGVYQPAAIDSQLDLAARSYVNQEVALDGDRLLCPRLFKWFRRDFDVTGGVVEFLLRYLDDGPARRALTGAVRPRVAFRPWDWSLDGGRPG